MTRSDNDTAPRSESAVGWSSGETASSIGRPAESAAFLARAGRRSVLRVGEALPLSGTGLFVLLSVVVGLLSLTLRFTPGYDPWTWALWGREAAQLDLSTVNGPAWKPLPVLLLLFASPLGHNAIVVWVVVARAAGVLAILATGRLAYRAARPILGLGGAAVAAGVAGVGLALSAGFSGFLWPLAMSEPLLAASVLLAIDRLTQGRWNAGFALLTGAALLRPEAWPLLFVAGLLVVRKASHRLRRCLIPVGIVGGVLVAWYVPDWLGSGDLMRSAKRAAIPSEGGPLVTGHPALALLQSAGRLLPVAWILLGGLAVLLLALRAYPRVPQRSVTTRTVALVTAVSVIWLATELLLTATGRSSGESRYLVVTTACLAVLSGVGAACVAWLLRLGWNRLTSLASSGYHREHNVSAVGFLSVATMIACALVTAVPFGQKLRAELRAASAHAEVDHDVAAVLARVGPGDLVRRCGTPVTGRYQVPEIAFQLGLHLRQLEYDPARTGLVVEVPGSAFRKNLPPMPDVEVITVGTVTMWATRPCHLAGLPRPDAS